MRLRLAVLVLLLPLAFTQTLAAPSPKQVTVTVKVIDPAGAVVENVRVLLFSASDRFGAPSEARTSRDGKAELIVKEGLYDLVLTTAGTGFDPVVKQVPIDADHSRNFKFELKVAKCISPYCEY
jgi:hypothetical protein